MLLNGRKWQAGHQQNLSKILQQSKDQVLAGNFKGLRVTESLFLEILPLLQENLEKRTVRLEPDSNLVKSLLELAVKYLPERSPNLWEPFVNLFYKKV